MFKMLSSGTLLFHIIKSFSTIKAQNWPKLEPTKQLLRLRLSLHLTLHKKCLQWCRARDLFGSQIPVTTGGLELRISCIRSSYLTH